MQNAEFQSVLILHFAFGIRRQLGGYNSAANTSPYLAHEYRRAEAAAASSIAARSRVVKNSSTARASASTSSDGKTIPFFPSTISGSPPASLAMTGRPK